MMINHLTRGNTSVIHEQSLMLHENNDYLESLRNLFRHAHGFIINDRKSRISKHTRPGPSTTINKTEGYYTSNNGPFIMRGTHVGIYFIHNIDNKKLKIREKHDGFIISPEDTHNQMLCDDPLKEAFLGLSFHNESNIGNDVYVPNENNFPYFTKGSEFRHEGNVYLIKNVDFDAGQMHACD